jgi:hypothetical protein
MTTSVPLKSDFALGLPGVGDGGTGVVGTGSACAVGLGEDVACKELDAAVIVTGTGVVWTTGFGSQAVRAIVSTQTIKINWTLRFPIGFLRLNAAAQ